MSKQTKAKVYTYDDMRGLSRAAVAAYLDAYEAARVARDAMYAAERRMKRVNYFLTHAIPAGYMEDDTPAFPCLGLPEDLVVRYKKKQYVIKVWPEEGEIASVKRVDDYWSLFNHEADGLRGEANIEDILEETDE